MDVFEEPVLRDFARGVESARRSWCQRLRVQSAWDGCRCRFAQQRLWFLAQNGGSKQSLLTFVGLRLRGRLDKVALKRALDRIVGGTNRLRTTFAMVEGEPRQRDRASGRRAFSSART